MQIFISYSSKDRPLVEALASDLVLGGHTVWYDQHLSGGREWWKDIIEHIQICDAFIFTLSPSSLASYPCSLEYGYADALNKPILPVQLVDFSVGVLPTALSRLQIVDYRDAGKQSALRLSRALSTLPLSQAMPNPLPPPPDAPLSILNRVADKLQADSLTMEQQSTILNELRQALSIDTAGAVELLQKLRRRPDLYSLIVQEIDTLLQASAADPKPNAVNAALPRAVSLNAALEWMIWFGGMLIVFIVFNLFFAVWGSSAFLSSEMTAPERAIWLLLLAASLTRALRLDKLRRSNWTKLIAGSLLFTLCLALYMFARNSVHTDAISQFGQVEVGCLDLDSEERTACVQPRNEAVTEDYNRGMSYIFLPVMAPPLLATLFFIWSARTSEKLRKWLITSFGIALAINSYFALLSAGQTIRLANPEITLPIFRIFSVAVSDFFGPQLLGIIGLAVLSGALLHFGVPALVARLGNMRESKTTSSALVQ